MSLFVPLTLDDQHPRSELPAGGSPADDRAYLAWRDELLGRALERHVARRWHAAFDPQPRLEPWRFDAALYAALVGSLLPDPVIASHRTRFLAVALKRHPRRLLTLAWRIITDGLGHSE